MSTKLIYFVRHGETILNAEGIHQGPDGKLTDKGRAQALETAKRFPKEKGRPEVMYASPFERTRETAEIIACELEMSIKSIKYTDLLMERRNPSEIIGHSGLEPKVRQIVEQMDKSFHEDNFRYSDEENFTDLKARAKKLLRFIAWRPHQRMIMVTHGIFLKMVIAYMLHGDKLTATEYNKLSYSNTMDNAGMTICTYTTHWFKRNAWKLLVWNDLM